MNERNFSEGYINELQSRSQRTVVVESGVVLVITVVSLVGNSAICITMFKNPRLHTVPNFYILSIVLADIFMALLVMPLSFGVLVTSHWPFGTIICNIQGSVMLILTIVSSSTVALMALNRYCRFLRPSLYRKLFTINKSTCMMLSLWGLVIFLVLLPIIWRWAVLDFNPQRASCIVTFTSQSSNKIFTSLHLVIPMAVTIVCYLRIFIKVRRNSTSVYPGLRSNRQSGRNEMTTSEINITRLIQSIVLGFILCWVPVLIIEVINTLITTPGSLPRWVYMLYKLLQYTSAAINPVIYDALNRSFRKEARQTIAKSMKRKQFIEHEV